MLNCEYFPPINRILALNSEYVLIENKRFDDNFQLRTLTWRSVKVSTLYVCLPVYRMDFHISINWTSPIPILGLLGGIFHFYSNFKRNLCLQTVENLIRRRVLLACVFCFFLLLCHFFI